MWLLCTRVLKKGNEQIQKNLCERKRREPSKPDSTQMLKNTNQNEVSLCSGPGKLLDTVWKLRHHNSVLLLQYFTNEKHFSMLCKNKKYKWFHYLLFCFFCFVLFLFCFCFVLFLFLFFFFFWFRSELYELKLQRYKCKTYVNFFHFYAPIMTRK